MKKNKQSAYVPTGRELRRYKKGKENVKKTKLIFGFMLMMLLAMSTSLMAVDHYYVRNDGNNANDGSADDAANAWATIQYAVDNVSNPKTTTIVIHVASGDYYTPATNTYIDINEDCGSVSGDGLTIQGAGEGSTIVQAAGAPDTATNRVFEISGDIGNFSDEIVTLKDMTIRNGHNSFTGGNGINNSSATLTLTNCTISGNSGTTQGGGITNKGILTMNSCTVSGNESTTSNGGGILNTQSSSELYMTNCTLSGNKSDTNGGGIYNYAGTIEMTGCTISGNECLDWGEGGGIFNTDNGTITMTNCTVSGNEAIIVATAGGGISSYSGTVTLTNCTISGNQAGGSGTYGCGGYIFWGGTLNIKNTIIANNTDGGGNSDYYYDSGTLTDNGYNLVEITNVGAGSGGFTNTTNNDIVGEQASLNLSSTLADNSTLNGTKTLKTTTGSVAINAGDAAVDGENIPPTNDQRGAGRKDATDIGAYEWWDDAGSLPVTLSTFTAQFIENTPTLYWTTQSETDNMGWFVYRNIENDFSTSEKISGFIEGHGTTTEPQSYIFEDTIENPETGDVYYYWLESVDYGGMVNHYDKVAVLVIPNQNDPGSGLIPEPEQYGLLQNEPNPFIESTKISFNLPETAHVELSIYNLKGQLVKSLYSGVASSQTLNWNGKDENGKTLSAGVYLYKLLINGKTAETKKLILMN